MTFAKSELKIGSARKTLRDSNLPEHQIKELSASCEGETVLV